MTSAPEIIPIKEWLGASDPPLVISGPCSAESEKQVRDTALALTAIPQVKVFRAGIWKPRTRPGAFEGVGVEGLTWLQKVKADTGLKVTVEVANPLHVRQALDHGVDILWIGARTVVNPFSVQEIAEAIQAMDVPVMVKNPLNPDLKTWLGALERIRSAGIRKLVAVHRGFSFFSRSPFRNAPMWEIPIELKRLWPDLPVLNDPSHICGQTSSLAEISQKALDLEMNGLMIETHIRPEEALTDRRQQITPGQLKTMLQMLVIRSEAGEKGFLDKLEELRSEIDKLDEEMIGILARRMAVIEEIGKFKKENRITILQLKRWNQIIRERVDTGIRMNLNREFILKLLEIIHDESIQRQIDVMKEGD